MRRRLWFALALALSTCAGAREPNVLPEDLARAVDAAIADLARDGGDASVEESTHFLLEHGDVAGEPLRRAKASASGIHLVRIVSILEAMEAQHRQRREEREHTLRNILFAEPMLRFLLAMVWLIAILVVARVARHQWLPVLEGYAQTWNIHVDPRTLLGIERLVGGLIVLVGVNIGVVLFVIQGLPAETKGYYDGIRNHVFKGLFFLAFGYGLLKIIDVAFDSMARRVWSGAEDRLIPILRNGVKVILVAATILLVLQNLSVAVDALLLAAGVLGLGLALGAREMLANLFGWMGLASERSFSVGDRVVVDGVDGYVESIGFQSVRLRTQEGTLATVPNSVLGRASVNNLTRRPHTRRAFSIHLDLATPGPLVEKALAIARDVPAQNPEIQESWAHLTGATLRGLEIQVVLWCREVDARRVLEDIEEIHLEIKRRFDEQGITPHLARASATA